MVDMKGLAKGLGERRVSMGLGPLGQEGAGAASHTRWDSTGHGGSMELEDVHSCPAAHGAMMLVFGTSSLPARRRALTTGQSQERSPESLPSNLPSGSVTGQAPPVGSLRLGLLGAQGAPGLLAGCMGSWLLE